MSQAKASDIGRRHVCGGCKYLHEPDEKWPYNACLHPKELRRFAVTVHSEHQGKCYELPHEYRLTDEMSPDERFRRQKRYRETRAKAAAASKVKPPRARNDDLF